MSFFIIAIAQHAIELYVAMRTARRFLNRYAEIADGPDDLEAEQLFYDEYCPIFPSLQRFDLDVIPATFPLRLRD